MNVLFQLLAAVLFILLERGRHVRGPWRRKEWRNVFVQGFWLARPMPAGECLQFLRDWPQRAAASGLRAP